MLALLRLGGDVDCLDIDCATPLILAAAAGHREACVCLLEGGAVVTREDAMGRHSLAHAVMGGHAEVVSLLAPLFRSLKLSSFPREASGLVAGLVSLMPVASTLDCEQSLLSPPAPRQPNAPSASPLVVCVT